jgi:hypothetical protein
VDACGTEGSGVPVLFNVGQKHGPSKGGNHHIRSVCHSNAGDKQALQLCSTRTATVQHKDGSHAGAGGCMTNTMQQSHAGARMHDQHGKAQVHWLE